jgi:hypothetical protein
MYLAGYYPIRARYAMLAAVNGSRRPWGVLRVTGGNNGDFCRTGSVRG